MTDIETIYGERVRLRVCGILRHRQRVLLLNHAMLNEDHIFWNFPGGGLEEGENIISALQREFREETHLEVAVHELVHIHQHIAGKLHGVELYFRVSAGDLHPRLGNDPEGNILTELRWFTENDLTQLKTGHCPGFLKEIAFRK
ncbi:NUDIX domain-containing protein [Leadbetterella sp. DM7]|uniref:NUDIX domain-containing protein n=1 Tax=Leadbetterella sp. DM7 TaxID=3235085 RepID=UPI00349E5EAF